MKGVLKAGLILLGAAGAVGLGVLISFGVVTAKFAWKEAEVERSLSHPAVPGTGVASPGEIVVNVKKGGEIQVGTTLLSTEQLHDRLKRISAVYPDQAVIIRGESEAEFTEIMAVLDGCQKAGIWNVAFASAKPVPAMP